VLFVKSVLDLYTVTILNEPFMKSIADLTLLRRVLRSNNVSFAIPSWKEGFAPLRSTLSSVTESAKWCTAESIATADTYLSI
jgi:hypothetical protein